MSPEPLEAGAAAAAPAPTETKPGAKPEPRALADAARAFESLFVEALIRRMRDAQLEDGFFGSGAGSAVYEGLFERYLAEQLTARSPLGIARMLERQWAGDPAGADAAERKIRALGAERAYENVLSDPAFPGPTGPPGPATQVPGPWADEE